MPFYEYECTHCKFYSELLQKISDPPLKKCPSCGRSTMKKLVSAPNFRLKGGGWYETDFKSDQENKRNLAVDKEPPAAGGDAAAATKAADALSGNSKPGDSKAAESKSTEPKVADSKPAAESASGARRKTSHARKPAASRARVRPKAAARRRPRR